jgi:hypothetical protein
MILIKTKSVIIKESLPVYEEVDGRLEATGEMDVVDRVVPEGLESIPAIQSSGTVGTDRIWLVDDDVVPANDPRRCVPTDLPVFRRTGHPLDGKRLAPIVPSGMPDCVVDDNGTLVPAIEPPPEIIEEPT